MIAKDGNAYRVSSPMVIANARALLAAGRDLLGAETDVSLDLAPVREVDSSALAVLFAWQRSFAARGTTLHVVNPPASLLSLADLYGVAGSLPLAGGK
jgi:phospholipid transport system transporter-binding protein